MARRLVFRLLNLDRYAELRSKEHDSQDLREQKDAEYPGAQWVLLLHFRRPVGDFVHHGSDSDKAPDENGGLNRAEHEFAHSYREVAGQNNDGAPAQAQTVISKVEGSADEACALLVFFEASVTILRPFHGLRVDQQGCLEELVSKNPLEEQ